MDRATGDLLTGVQDTVRGQDRAASPARWVAAAVPEEVARVRAAVGAFASDHGAPDALEQDVRLAVSEALSNAVIHAYPGEPGRIDAQASVDPAAGLLTVSVRDYGTGFHPRSDSPGLGMGLPIMTAVAHAVELASPAGGGTEVRLMFDISPAGTAAFT
jgi:anti-sigma regulatory factor (Ser/Thr protein kinase)